jgi:hypothetical protein
MHVAWGIPKRMARAIDAVFAREGKAKHERKLDIIRDLMQDDERIPLATDTGAIVGAPAIWHAAEMAVRAVHQFCHQLQTTDAIIVAIAGECQRRGIAAPLGDTEKEQITRALCKAWWRRHLRTEWKRRFEHTSIQLGLTSVRNDPYISRESALIQDAQNKANRHLLEQRIATNENGQSFTVAELADKGMGNKTLRRGELMTRIRGFEEVADARRDVGMFWTITCPSKFHSVGGTNPKYDGATPRQAQAYLVEVWACIRAALHRVGIRPYGFRIAEPHSDGCPHWHMLLFVDRDQAGQMEAIIKHYALLEDGEEEGAQKNRVKLVRIEANKGTAAGYIVKYVCKNVDGAGVGDHKSFENGATYIIATDTFGQVEITPSQRVTYWSQVWGIRQFQQIGGAPVGVWRELRRVKADAITNAPDEVKAAHAACQKIESEDPAVNKQADFGAYMLAQGGPTVTRRALAVRIATREVTIKGRYATYDDKKPAGVYARAYPNEVYESVRYRWTIEAADGAGVALDSPWTGVNNCTAEAEFDGRLPRGMAMENRGDGTPGSGWNVRADQAREELFKKASPKYSGSHLHDLQRKNE